MPCYTDVESAFERFCILTVDGKMTDDEAFEWLKNRCTVPVYNNLQIMIYKITKGKTTNDKTN